MSIGVLSGFGVSLFMFFLPFLVLIWLRAKGIKQWFNALIGACVYFNFYYLVFNIVICNLVGGQFEGFAAMLANPYAKAMFIALAGGGLCEAGRYLGLRFGTGDSHTWVDALGLGLGYGVAATITKAVDLISTMALSSYVGELVAGGDTTAYLTAMSEQGYSDQEAQALLTQLQTLTFTDGAMYMIQILSTVIFAVALSILVLGVVRKDTIFKSVPPFCLIIAIASHIVTDAVPIIMQQGFGVSSQMIAVYLFVLMVLAAVFIVYSLRFHPGESIKETAGLEARKSAAKKAEKSKHIAGHATTNVKKNAALEAGSQENGVKDDSDQL